MESLTILIAATAGLIVLATRPLYGLCTYLTVLLFYPGYLRIPIGTADISATRIIVALLLLRCLIEPGLIGRFRWHVLDSLVLVSMIVFTITLSLTTPFATWLENRGGFILDSFLPYLAIRLLVVDRGSFTTVAKVYAIAALVLAVGAIIEAATGRSIYSGLGQYCSWAPNRGAEYQMRYGLNRAEGPYGETIMFGLFFVTAVSIIWPLRWERPPWKSGAFPATFTAAGGALATISSGPLTAMVIAAAGLMFERAKRILKPVLVAVVVLVISVEVISNRHFYDVVFDRIGFNAQNAWYRSELFEVAVRKLPEYWTTGYGLIDPGWGELIDSRKKTDVVNDYVLQAVRFGFFGFLAHVSVLFGALVLLFRVHRTAPNAWLRSTAWSLGAGLIGLMLALWSVALFTQMVSIFYVFLGLQAAVIAQHKLASLRVRQTRRATALAQALDGNAWHESANAPATGMSR